MRMTTPGVDIRRANTRFVTRTRWLESRHSFSFGPHYDPENTHHGILVVNNDDRVKPGTGSLKLTAGPGSGAETLIWEMAPQ